MCIYAHVYNGGVEKERGVMHLIEQYAFGGKLMIDDLLVSTKVLKGQY